MKIAYFGIIMLLVYLSATQTRAEEGSFLIMRPGAELTLSLYGTCKILRNPTKLVDVQLPLGSKEAWESIDTRKNSDGVTMVEVEACETPKG